MVMSVISRSFAVELLKDFWSDVGLQQAILEAIALCDFTIWVLFEETDIKCARTILLLGDLILLPALVVCLPNHEVLLVIFHGRLLGSLLWRRLLGFRRFN